MPMDLSDLVPNPGSNTDRKRVGRGPGSGKGKTAGKGSKGQKARSGRGVRRGFEGGQLPLQKRMPYKRGFTNIFAAQWEEVNLDRIEALGMTDVSPETLYEAGVIRGLEFPVKILGKGELSTAVKVSAHAVSEGAKNTIEAAGGSIELMERTDRWVTARPRSRRLPINRDLKKAGFGKSGGSIS